MEADEAVASLALSKAVAPCQFRASHSLQPALSLIKAQQQIQSVSIAQWGLAR